MADLKDIEGLDAAIAAATTKGREQGYAEGYGKGRADAAAIFTHEKAASHPGTAAKLASQPGMSVDAAVEVLSTLPAPQKGSSAGSYIDTLKATAPDLGPNIDVAEGERKARVEELSAIAKAAAAARG